MPDTLITVLIIVVSIVVLVRLVLLIVLLSKKKKKRIVVDEEFINNLISLLGDTSNILETNVDNGRLKIQVKNLDLVNFEKIKEIAESGVFITGNTIKTLFKLDSFEIKKALDERL